MDIILDHLAFLIKFIVIVFVIVVAISYLLLVKQPKDSLSITNLNKSLSDSCNTIKSQLGFKDKTPTPEHDKILYVLDFKGDVTASGVEQLRKEVTTILQIARPDFDKVLLKLESGGGTVVDYGLAAAQLERLRDSKIDLIVAIDKIAASGGYMMACIASAIHAAPFAIVGSIGVVAELPNFKRLLDSKCIDYEQFTAGRYKRTVGTFTEITPEAREKFQEQLDLTHELFKNLVKDFRNNKITDIEQVATGEYWYGEQAIKLGLVDSLLTSDDLILDAMNSYSVYSLSIGKKTGIALAIENAIVNIVSKLMTRASITPHNIHFR